MMLSGWGRFPTVYANVTAPRSVAELSKAVVQGRVIARGNGRAYGDSAISRQCTIDMRRFNRMISFDNKTGVLTAESGVLLADVVSCFLRRGWFPLVTPGTKFVTLGGMIAADVHGKNHHCDGSMMQCVEWIDIMGPDGKVCRASRDENTEIFDLSFGTMGLTGIILRAAIRLQPVETGWIRQTLIPVPDLRAAIEAFETHDATQYSVAWLDCLSKGSAMGRSLVMLGEHARTDGLGPRERKDPFAQARKRKVRLPIDAPGFAMSKLAIKAMNAAYYRNGRRQAGDTLVNWESFFYPLDAILDWNRVYGRNGFLQFQCVLPLETSKPGLEKLLKAISEAGAGSFLTVLKRFGTQENRFSFPMPGYTLALDFPANEKNLRLLKALDAITLDHGGRFYLAKDARMSAQTLAASDPRLVDFIACRHEMNAQKVFQSSQSERLCL